MPDPQPDNRLARKFLKRIWYTQLEHAPQGHPGHAFLAQKSADGSWTDTPLPPHTPLRLPRDTTNLYYGVNLFTEPRRLKRYVTGGCWLYADLDEVDPSALEDEIAPTIAIESSPGRYQALWRLDRWLSTRRLAELNQKMTYYTGADKGNWKMTQVLRVPGTVSTKHGGPVPVRLLWSRCGTRTYEPAALRAIIGSVETPQTLADARRLTLPTDSVRKLQKTHSGRLPARARKLLRTRVALGDEDRSARLWELTCLLLENGVPTEHTLKLIRATAWNKWSDDHDGGTGRLEQEVLRAEAHIKSKSPTSRRSTSSPSPRRKTSPRRKKNLTTKDIADDTDLDSPPHRQLSILPMSKFMAQSMRKPNWLVDGVWVDGAYGWWAGMYKSFKTMTLLDFAVSVASGKPFLGHFPVRRTGPVLYLFEEGQNAAIQNRLHNIHSARGLGGSIHTNGNGDTTHYTFPTDIPLDVFDRVAHHGAEGGPFSLSDDDCRHQLEAYVHDRQPVAVLLEAFYLITGGVDENSASEVKPVLEFLKGLSSKYPRTNIIVSHHYNKSSEDRSRSTDRISGSGALLRWYESSIELERIGEEEDSTVSFKATHRDAAPLKPVALQFTLEDGDSYDVTVLEDEIDLDLPDQADRLTPEKLDRLLESYSDGATLAELESATGVTRTQIRRVIQRHKFRQKKKRRDGREQVVVYPRSRPAKKAV